MNISGIRPSAGFYSYNSIKINELRNSQILQSKQAKESVGAQSQDDGTSYDEARARQQFGPVDFADRYDPKATYDMKGADSDINSLDVEKAVSDLDKDKMLQQYQYFVGSSDGMITPQSVQTEATNRERENFVL